MAITYSTTWTFEDGAEKTINHKLNATELSVEITNVETGEAVIIQKYAQIDTDNLKLTGVEAPEVDYTVTIRKVIV